MTQLEKPETNLRVAELPPPESHDEPEGVRFPEFLIVLAKRKGLVLVCVGAAIILGVLLSLLWPNTYTANARIMPPQQNQSLSTTALLNQFGPLMGLAGGLNVRNSSDVYVAVLRSRTVSDALVDRFKLMTLYNTPQRVDARNKLEDRTQISPGKEGVISITVDDRDAQRAADIANAYVDELETLSKTLAVTEAGKRRLFFEREVKQANDDLAAAENALKQTQEKTGLVLLDSQSRGLMESLISLRAKIAAQEVMVESMQTYATAENPDLVRAKQELAALRKQESELELGNGKQSIASVAIENVPAAGLEYIRKYRDVKYHEALFELLAKQFEAAKLDEARDALIVQQLDKAVRPEKRSWPKPSILLLVSALAGLLIGVLSAFFIENLERAKADPQFSARIQMFRFYLWNGKRS
jgi:uncharacterized protein involved in exopolysaccharide biosynthesis